MTFLEIVKRTRQECGIAGDGPTTVVNQSREMKRLVDWCAQAYTELQELRDDWEWLRGSFAFNTVAGQQSYAPDTDILLTDFASWKNYSFRSYLQSAGVGSQIILGQYESYTDFRDYHLLGSRQLVQARPIEIAIQPNKSLIIGPTPDDVYVVTGEYYKTPQTLALDADVPGMPARFHMAIVYGAMVKYGFYEVAQEQIAAGQAGYNLMVNKLLADQLPMVAQSGGLI